MTTDSRLERYTIIALMTDEVHGQDGRSDAQANASWTPHAGGQDASRSREGRWRGAADGIHMEGPSGRRRHRGVTRHDHGPASAVGCGPVGGLARSAAARSIGTRFRYRVVDTQTRTGAHRATVWHHLQRGPCLATAGRAGLQFAKARAPGHRTQ